MSYRPPTPLSRIFSLLKGTLIFVIAVVVPRLLAGIRRAWNTLNDRRNRRLRFALLISLLALMLFLWHLDAMYWGSLKNLGSHLRNYRYDNALLPCGLRKQPYIMLAPPNHLQISWETNCKFDRQQLRWSNGAETGKEWLSFTPSLTKIDAGHSVYGVRVELLSEPSYYQYFIRLESGGYETPTFTTGCLSGSSAGKACTPIRLACVADNQFGARTFDKIIKQVATFQPQYLIHGGDAVQDFDQLANWQTDFFDVVDGLSQRVPLIYAPGNHDDGSGSESVGYLGVSDSFTLLKWHALSIGHVRIIVLNSNVDSLEQDQFLAEELKSVAFQAATFRIVMVHIPPFMEFWDPITWERGEKDWGKFVRDRYVPQFEANGIDLVISGHQHNYQRGERNGVTYTIIGGAGGQLESDRVADWKFYALFRNVHHFIIIDIYDRLLRWRCFDVDGVELDSFTLSK